MRHISQITKEELIVLINDIDKKRRAALGVDDILYHQLYDLGNILSTEAQRRAKAIGVAYTAEKLLDIKL